MNDDDKDLEEFKNALSEESINEDEPSLKDVDDFEPIDESEEVFEQVEDLNNNNFVNRETINRNVDRSPKRQNKFVSKNKDNHNGEQNKTESQNKNFGDKVNDMKNKFNKIAHPIDTLKNNVQEKGQEALKNTGNKVKEKAKEGAAKAVKFVVKKVPIWVWPILAGIILVIIILAVIIGIVLDDENDSSLYDENCEVFSLKVTSLTKSEFVEKASTYLDGRSGSAETFKNNLELIYSLSVRNNVNPELVVVRAVNEGFSPGDSKYNYWGLGCTNTGGYDACMTFSDFQDGLMYFINYVSQYDSVTSLMSRYTYIGKYWYNPGGSGLGGCYYYPYIKQYMSEARAKEVEKICQDVDSKRCSPEDTTHCVATTDEDQKAKAAGSVYSMAERRQEIFGLPPDDCKKAADVNCTIYAQGDSRWGNIHLGRSSSTMATSGCAVTSIAIGMSCGNMELTVSEFDAGVLINSLNAGNCFTDGGAIKWNCSALRGIAPTLNLVSSNALSSGSDPRTTIKSIDPENHLIITHFKNSAHVRGHYVLYSEEKDSSTYLAKDPSGSITTQYYGEVDQIVVYEFVPIKKNWNKKIDSNTSNYTILNKPVRELLSAEEYNSLNDKIYNSVNTVGAGTREAIVEAATIPIEYFSSKNVLIPYTYGGGHYNKITDLNGNIIDDTSNSFYGVDPNWGTRVYVRNGSTIYNSYGPDCTAWVAWVYHNAGINMGVRNIDDYLNMGTKHEMDGDYIGKVGDLIVSSGHIKVIVGVDESSNKYYVSHAKGGMYGVIIDDQSFYTDGSYVVDMESYINRNKIGSYVDDFRNGVKPY